MPDEAAGRPGERLYALFHVGAYYGLRRSELMACSLRAQGQILRPCAASSWPMSDWYPRSVHSPPEDTGWAGVVTH